ncbi:hypothetical protein [Candidatus Nanohalococcus occultus]|uniref:Uncharacterized protein n=1 Tax=Candidatus Nanohalococcus occultus TaxID=2978047 RepID=A0ABY8CHX5_9ARCH|nr:hypothetical protein SVXNc_0589 [Candidatus Nanohaloarchaeota archaeon SVXNc]
MTGERTSKKEGMLDHLSTQKPDDFSEVDYRDFLDRNVLDDLGINVETDESYDMRMRADKEELAKDLHRMEDEFYKIAWESKQVKAQRQISRRSGGDCMLPQWMAEDMTEEIESSVYNRLLEISGSVRHVGQSELETAFSEVAEEYTSGPDNLAVEIEDNIIDMERYSDSLESYLESGSGGLSEPDDSPSYRDL